jgi:tryptophan synthase alpha chain
MSKPSVIEERIRATRRDREILLISHAVLGYPSFEACRESIDEMMAASVELVELQIPFSEPQADGPFFTMANQQALDNGLSVAECLDFAAQTCRRHPTGTFIFMTYFNILFKFGVSAFVKRAAQAGIKGMIIPDLPIEESSSYVKACETEGIDPIFMFAPSTPIERMKDIAKMSRGFVYCQAREGVTGSHTQFGPAVADYIARCRAATDLPLAVGFGIQTKEDVDFLRGRADVAICCTQAVKVLASSGAKAMGQFLRGLR